MRLKVAAIAIAIVAAAAVAAGHAEAQTTKKKRVVTDTRGNTVFISRDENGRTRTRVIIQKRSYLDPGTETFPGERSDHDYAQLPNSRPLGIFDNTFFGTNDTALPNLWTLPGKNNPFLQY